MSMKKIIMIIGLFACAQQINAMEDFVDDFFAIDNQQLVEEMEQDFREWVQYPTTVFLGSVLGLSVASYTVCKLYYAVVQVKKHTDITDVCKEVMVKNPDLLDAYKKDYSGKVLTKILDLVKSDLAECYSDRDIQKNVLLFLDDLLYEQVVLAEQAAKVDQE